MAIKVKGRKQRLLREEEENQEAEDQEVETTEDTSKDETTEDDRGNVLENLIQILAGLNEEELEKVINMAQGIVEDAPEGGKDEDDVEVFAQNVSESLFAGKEFSKDFKEQASKAIQKYVENAVAKERGRIEKEFLNKERHIKQKLGQYVDYTAKQWLKENKVAQKTNKTVRESRQLFRDLAKTLEQNGYNIDHQGKQKINELRESLNKTLKENASMRRQVAAVKKESILSKKLEGLSVMQQEKFKKLAESVPYNDEKSFEKRLDIIRENISSKTVKPVSKLESRRDNIRKRVRAKLESRRENDRDDNEAVSKYMKYL